MGRVAIRLSQDTYIEESVTSDAEFENNVQHLLTDVFAQIKEKKLKLLTIECGCGSALSSRILMVPGASKVLEASYVPYSLDSQDAIFGKTMYGLGTVNNQRSELTYKVRAVSLDNLRRLAHGALMKHATLKQSNDKLVYVATFSITGTVPHGWIGVFSEITGIAWHVTLPHEAVDYNRSKILGDVAQCGMAAILKGLNPNLPSPPYADDVVYLQPARCHDEVMLYRERIISLVHGLHKYKGIDRILCFNGDETVGRVIDVARGCGDGALHIYKGSFNPLSAAHMAISIRTNAVLMMNTETFDKGVIDASVIADRVLAANRLGFTVLVSKKGLFSETAWQLRKHEGIKTDVKFVVGSDTFERLLSSSNVVDQPTAIGLLKVFKALDVGFLCIRRVDRGGRTYGCSYIDLSNLPEPALDAGLSVANFFSDFPSSTELRQREKERLVSFSEDLAIALNSKIKEHTLHVDAVKEIAATVAEKYITEHINDKEHIE